MQGPNNKIAVVVVDGNYCDVLARIFQKEHVGARAKLMPGEFATYLPAGAIAKRAMQHSIVNKMDTMSALERATLSSVSTENACISFCFSVTP